MRKDKLTVLAIDDEPCDAEALHRCLGRLPKYEVEFVHCIDASQALGQLERPDIDVVFLDYRLGGEIGSDLLSTLRQRGDIRPVVVLTGQGNEYVAVDLIRAGADAYLVKADLNPESAGRAIELAQAQSRRRTAEREVAERNERIEHLSRQLVEANIQLAQSSRIDFLTQVLTRAAWAESVALEHQRSLRHNHPYCVLMIDVDRFKQYNDTFGHQKGDECLVRVAREIGCTCRCFDLVARYGGEEFIVLAPETDLVGGTALGNRIREAVWDRSLTHPGSEKGRVTVSVGVAAGPTEHWESAVHSADEALYRAKKNGRDQVCTAQAKPTEPVPAR